MVKGSGTWKIESNELCLTAPHDIQFWRFLSGENCWKIVRWKWGFAALDSKGNEDWTMTLNSHPKHSSREELYAALKEIYVPPVAEAAPSEAQRVAEAKRKKKEEQQRIRKLAKEKAKELAKLKEQALAKQEEDAKKRQTRKKEKTPKPKPAKQVAKKTTQPKIPQFKKVPKRPDDIAVIIANSNYKKLGKGIPNVTPAYADAEGIKRYFMNAKGVREGNIIYLKDATGTQLTSVFGSEKNHKGKLFNWTKPNVSKVYVYYAGHGAPAGDKGTTYLVPSDADSETVQLTGYPLKQLYRNLGKIPATSITVILEACFSGQSQGGYLSRRISGISVVPKMPLVPSKITVISAGAANQVATWEEDESQSLFTKYFLKGMSGEGDKPPYGNGDGKVTYKELGKYLEGTMTYFARRYYGREQRAQIVSGG